MTARATRRAAVAACSLGALLSLMLAPRVAFAQAVGSDSSHVPLNRFNNGEHWETSGPVSAGYRFESTLGFMLAGGGPNLQPLYGCLTGGSDHFLSGVSNCEGQTFLRREGFAYGEPPPGIPTKAIYRCLIPGGEHFTSNTAGCEGAARDEALLGYLAARQAALNRYACTPADHIVTSRGVDRPCTLESRLGYLLGAAGPNRVELFSCRAGADQFLSLAADCEGQAPIGSEGWLYQAPPGPGAVALYRCAATDRFASLDPGCESRQRELLLGFLLTDELDQDADGVSRPADCNDSNAAVHPGAVEIPGNGVDENCVASLPVLPRLRPLFATRASGHGVHGRLVALSGLGNLPNRTVVGVVCARGCRSKRVSFSIRRHGKHKRVGKTLPRSVRVTKRTRIRVTARHPGYTGRYGRYRFRAKFGGLVAVRTASGCLTTAKPRRAIRCP